MNMKARKPLPQTNTKVDLSKAETLKCESCGNFSFIQSFFIKKVSAIMSPNGQEAIVPVQVLVVAIVVKFQKYSLKELVWKRKQKKIHFLDQI